MTFEKHTFDESYLEFLDTQIELAPRGPAWTELLRARRSAFERCVGDVLLRIGVRRGDAEFVGHCRASDGEVLHSEIV